MLFGGVNEGEIQRLCAQRWNKTLILQPQWSRGAPNFSKDGSRPRGLVHRLPSRNTGLISLLFSQPAPND